MLKEGPRGVLGVLRIAGLVLALTASVALGLIALYPGLADHATSDDITAALRAAGGWGIALAIALIAADIVLPIPTTAVMTALGVLHGPLLGGLAATVGSFLAGMIGYGAARALGPETARRLAGRRGLAQATRLFDSYGGWIVALSRWLPVLPETVSLVAGLVRMRPGPYAFALACGAAPLGFAFATLGHLGADSPLLATLAGALLPVALWAVIAPRLLRHHRSPLA